MICIYCLEDKNRNQFTKTEHVIPQAFGLFKNSFTLNEIVCDDCNQYFGDHLEVELARDTFEGMVLRYNHKIKKSKEFKTVGKRSRILFKIAEGEKKGQYAYQEYSKETGEIVWKPLPQIGFFNTLSSEFIYFLLDKVPDKKTLEQKGFDLSPQSRINIFGCDKELAKETLKKKGITLYFGGELDYSKKSSAIIEYKANIDDNIFRAIAKIGFNYLTYWEGADFVRQSSFNAIREYIRNGIKANYPLISIENNSILADEQYKKEIRVGHIITINWASDRISLVAQISLSNYAKYCVCLANEYSGENRNIKRGHFFNIQGYEILELGTI